MRLEHKINRCLYQYLSLDDYEQEKVEDRVNTLLDDIIKVLDHPYTSDASDESAEPDISETSENKIESDDDWKPLIDCGYFRNFCFTDRGDDVYTLINVEDKSRFTIYGSDMDKLNFGDLKYIYGRFTKGLSFGKEVSIYECNVVPKTYRKIVEMHLIQKGDTVQAIPPVVEEEVCHTDLGDVVRPITKPTYTSLYERNYDELDIQCCDRVIVHNIVYDKHFFTSSKVDLECKRHIKEFDVKILKYSVTSYEGCAQFDLWVSDHDYELLGDTRPLVKKCPLNADTIVKFNSDTFDETEGIEFGFIKDEDKFKTLRYNHASFKDEYVLFTVDKQEMVEITAFIERVEE